MLKICTFIAVFATAALFSSSADRRCRVDDGFYIGAFNGAEDIGPVFENIQKAYQISNVVETGTFQGKTTAFFAVHFDQVHTIDISEYYYKTAQQTLSGLTNIEFHLGSSEQVLAQILPSMKDQFTLFYLDAHWYDFWPLRSEIEQISKTHRNNCIIVIDDVKVPGRPDIPYDSYKSHECSYEYVKDLLDKVFDHYIIRYVIPENVFCRAKLVVFPL